MVKHKAVKCNVKGCREEAKYWIPTDELSGDFDMKARDTFYLCDMHAGFLSRDEYGYAYFLNPETGRLREIEIGIYSCSKDCQECNN